MLLRIKQGLMCLVVVIAMIAVVETTERSSSYFEIVRDVGTGAYRYREGSVIVWGREGFGRTTIGLYGMIVRKEIASGQRVLFLGDSITESLQVDDEKKYTEVFQAELNRRSATPVTSINMAMSGASPVEYVANLPAWRKVFQPDLIVVQVSSADFEPNDVTAKSLASRPSYLEFGRDGVSVRQNPNYSPPGARPLARLGIRLGLFSTYARASWRIGEWLKPALARANEQAVKTDESAAENEGIEDYRNVVRFLLSALAEESAAAGAKLVVLYVPSAPRIHDGALELDEGPPNSKHAMQRAVIAQACADLRLRFLDPRERLTAFTAATGQLPFGFGNSQPGSGHLNEQGHRLMAEFLVESLSPTLAVNR